MTTLESLRRYGEDIENSLKLKTSPIAVKMLKSADEIPEGAIRPKRDKGYHLAQCQAFAMSRRQGLTIAMLKEDHWCWAPLMAYGIVEDPNDAFVNAHASFPRFKFGEYIGILTSPLRTVTFEPDMALIYSNTAQLREMIGIAKNIEKTTIKSEFDPIDSCAYSIIPVIRENQYRITLPDPGEKSRAFAEDDEIILSVPKDRITGLAAGIKRSMEMKKKGDDWSHTLLRPDFPRPDFYIDLFRKWGLEVEK
jgi:uncharacterized protein (DUF169 family)